MRNEIIFGVFVNRHNDPRKNDPTKQDERDNDHTRIRQEPTPKKNPETPTAPPEEPETRDPLIQKEKNNKKESESPLKSSTTPPEKNHPGTLHEHPENNEPYKRNFNPVVPEKKETDSIEQDNEGNVVLQLVESIFQTNTF